MLQKHNFQRGDGQSTTDFDEIGRRRSRGQSEQLPQNRIMICQRNRDEKGLQSSAGMSLVQEEWTRKWAGDFPCLYRVAFGNLQVHPWNLLTRLIWHLNGFSSHRNDLCSTWKFHKIISSFQWAQVWQFSRSVKKSTFPEVTLWLKLKWKTNGLDECLLDLKWLGSLNEIFSK